MARRPIELSLYKVLVDSGFKCVKRGIRKTDEIYSAVHRKYDHLCDDEFQCSHYHAEGNRQPEWNHVVRQALNRCKTTCENIDYSKKLKFWIFV